MGRCPTDFDDFGAVGMRRTPAFQRGQNHQNPLSIDPDQGHNLIPSDGMKIRLLRYCANISRPQVGCKNKVCVTYGFYSMVELIFPTQQEKKPFLFLELTTGNNFNSEKTRKKRNKKGKTHFSRKIYRK